MSVGQYEDDVNALALAFADEFTVLDKRFRQEMYNQYPSQNLSQPTLLDSGIWGKPSKSDQQTLPLKEMRDFSINFSSNHKEHPVPAFSEKPKESGEKAAFTQDVSEASIINLAFTVLLEHGPLPIGKLGSLMHKVANDHTLPALFKERFGGLKKFVQSHPDVFALGDDHPYNPHVGLVSNDVALLQHQQQQQQQHIQQLQPTQSIPIVAMDCEMVGVGVNGAHSSLARCSIVDFNGTVLYDRYVKQTQRVTDYRTHVSGIRAQDLQQGTDFATVRQEVAAIVAKRVIVGHSLKADLEALQLPHDRQFIRDTAYFPGLCPDRPRSLKCLVRERIGVNFQRGEHDSVEDARAVLALYKSVAEQWELAIAMGLDCGGNPCSFQMSWGCFQGPHLPNTPPQPHLPNRMPTSYLSRSLQQTLQQPLQQPLKQPLKQPLQKPLQPLQYPLQQPLHSLQKLHLSPVVGAPLHTPIASYPTLPPQSQQLP